MNLSPNRRALFFTLFGVPVTPPLFALIVESGGCYGTAFAFIASPSPAMRTMAAAARLAAALGRATFLIPEFR